MRYLYLVVVLSFGVLQVNAQEAKIDKKYLQEELNRKNAMESMLHSDTQKSIKRLKQDFNNERVEGLQKRNDHVVLLPLQQRKVGHNGKGADIMVLQPYNMPSISPDSTFAATMPVLGYTERKVPRN